MFVMKKLTCNRKVEESNSTDPLPNQGTLSPGTTALKLQQLFPSVLPQNQFIFCAVNMTVVQKSGVDLEHNPVHF